MSFAATCFFDLEETKQVFNTERFVVVSLIGQDIRNLLGVLLQDEALSRQISCITVDSKDDALREAFCLEVLCNAGQAKAWSIIDRERRMQIGAIVAKQSLEGLDVEVLVASQFWDQGVSEEAAEPVMEWLQRYADERITELH